MVYTIISRTADLTKPTEIDALEGRLYTNDDEADQFRIRITRNGAAVDLTGASVQGYFQRVDGVTLKIAGSVDGEEAVLTLDERCYTLPGRFMLAIKVTLGAVCHTVYACRGGVMRSQTDTVYVPDGDLEPTMEELLERIATLDNRVDAIQSGVEIVPTVSGEIITVSDAKAKPLRSLHIMGKTTQDGAPTPENPVDLVSAGNDGNIKATVCGRNLIRLEPNEAEVLGKGISFSASNGGTRLVGTSNESYAQNKRSNYDPLNLPAGQYTLKIQIEGTTNGASFGVMITKDGANLNAAQGQQTGTYTFTIEDGHSYGCFVYMIESGKTVDCVVKAMLVPGTEAAPWEPYNGQTLTASTPNGLPGIPVTSGGNYTDENGQQWVCDEIDLERGVYIQRCITAQNFESAETYDEYVRYVKYTTYQLRGGANAPALCNITDYYSYSNDARSVHFYVDSRSIIVYVKTGFDITKTPICAVAALANPIETALSADDLAAYRAMHTNAPNTTICTDAGCGVVASYVADTQMYIDQRTSSSTAALNALLEGIMDA